MGDCNVPFYFGRRAGGGLGQGSDPMSQSWDTGSAPCPKLAYRLLEVDCLLIGNF